ncbi:MAG: hypothetical protein ACXWLV_03915 [Rhizomicrobium sp.]
MRNALAGITIATVAAVLAPSSVDASVNLHGLYLAGDCAQPTIETIDVPAGRLSIHMHIRNWSAGAYASIPLWMSFQRYEPENGGYTGWASYVGNVAGPKLLTGVSSKRTPYEPKAGDEVDYVEIDQVISPFRMQVQIAGPTWHSGDGACHQGPMESWLTIDTGSDQGDHHVSDNLSGVEDPVADVTWRECAYPNATEGCGDWRFHGDGTVEGIVNGRVVWTGKWTRLGHYLYRYDFDYMGKTNHAWVRFTDPNSSGRATDLLGYPDASMGAPYRKGQRSTQ